MKNSFVLLLSFIAVALGITPAAAKPADIGLSFDLAPTAEPKPVVAQIPAVSEVQESTKTPAELEAKPLDLPDRAAQIPQGTARPPKPNILAELPPPPAPPEAEPTATASAAIEPASAVETRAIEPVSAPVREAIEPVSASAPQAEPAPSAATPEPKIDIAPAAQAPTQANLNALFQGDENSLVARSVGSAEGTRTPNGGRTWAYRGHTDPGNGVWNLGTFSYQHGADSPEAADRKQLERLNRQAQTLRQHAANHGLTLTLEEELNGIDLANQSPRAALSSGGYIDRLRQAHDMGLQGSDAVLWARTRAFLDPRTDRWNAPGLGNNVHSITADQERRRRAIARTIEVQPQIASAPPVAPDQTASLPTARREEAADAIQESIADFIISLDLPPS